jgi:hypothetical protein
MSRENHPMYDAVTLIATELRESLSASPPDLYVIAGAVGRARRLEPNWLPAELAGVVGGAESTLTEHRANALAALAAVDADEMVEVLAERLGDEEETPETLLSVLLDLDEWVCAAETLGATSGCESTLAEAVELVADFATSASALAPIARRLLHSLNVRPETPVHPLWAAFADATPGASLEVAEPLSELPRWLTARIDRALGPTRPPIRFVRPAGQAAAVALAADDGSMLLPPRAAVSIARDDAAGWELSYEAYTPFPLLVIYSDSPEMMPSVRLRSASACVSPVLDATGCRGTITLNSNGPWIVEIGDEVLDVGVEGDHG